MQSSSQQYLQLFANGVHPLEINSSPNRKARRMWKSTRFRNMLKQIGDGLSMHRREIKLDNGKLIHPTKGYGSARRRTVAPTSLRKKDT